MKIMLTQMFALVRKKGALGALFAGELIVAVSCENIQRNDQPVIETGSKEIIPNPDGTATVPPGSDIANCAANGINSVECLLAVGSYFYGIEYGGKIPLKDSNVAVIGVKQKTLDKGWYPGTTTVTFSDPQLKASNIRSGINIFGITGTATTTRPSNCDLASFL